MFSFNRDRKGFTILELLVAITVILILIAILFPVFARVRRTAQRTSCLNNLKDIGRAIRMYTNDWDDCYPLVSGFGPAFDKVPALWAVSPSPTAAVNTRGTGAWNRRYLPNLLYTYIKNTSLFICPSVGIDGTWEIFSATGTTKIIFANNYTRTIQGADSQPDLLNPYTDPPTTYIFNAWIWPNSTPGTGSRYVIAGSSEAMCLKPCAAALVWDAPSGRPETPEGKKIQLAHPGSINVVYADSHAKAVAIGEDPDENRNYASTADGHGHFWYVEGWKGWRNPLPKLP